jgi:hypothetical protein
LYSKAGHKVVHPEGVQAGARDAAEHLIKILDSAGPKTVLKALSRIHADVNDSMATFGKWGFGHYYGVTNVFVRIQYANKEGGLDAITGMLYRILGESKSKFNK